MNLLHGLEETRELGGKISFRCAIQILRYLHSIALSRIWGCTRMTVDGVCIDELDYYTPLGIASNYSAVANLHTLQITTAAAIIFPASVS
jgi:hypothetical protein